LIPLPAFRHSGGQKDNRVLTLVFFFILLLNGGENVLNIFKAFGGPKMLTKL
jgi:hypothetical protein